MPSLGSLLLLALIFVTIGFIGGALVSLLWVERDQGEAPPSVSKEKVPSPLKGADEIVSIWRDQSSQKLILQIGRDQYQDSTQLSDQKRSALEKVAVHWISWLRSSTGQLTEPLPRSEFILKQETESRLVQVTTPAEQAKGEENVNFLDSRMNAVEDQVLRQPPKKILSQPTSSATFKEPQKSGKEVEVVQHKSIVVQIDDILQEMISTMKDAPPGVRLMEDPKGGVIVWVGTEKFSGIDMVTDSSIQSLIRSAVAEWEKRAIH